MVRTFDDFMRAMVEADASHPQWQAALAQGKVSPDQEGEYLKRAKYVTNPQTIISDLSMKKGQAPQANQQVDPRAAQAPGGGVQGVRSLDDIKAAMAARAGASAANTIGTGTATAAQISQAKATQERQQVANRGGGAVGSEALQMKAAEMGVALPPAMKGQDLTDPKFAQILDQLGLVARDIISQGRRRRETGYAYPFYRDRQGNIKASTI